MKKNIGKIDKTLRIVIGLVIIAVGIIYKSWWGAVGLVPLLTAVISFCPIYLAIKADTTK